MSILSRAIKEQIDILEYAEMLGFHVEKIGKEYTLQEHNSIRINPHKKVFIRNATNQAGSVIDFAMFAKNISQDDAIKELRGLLPNNNFKEQITLPLPDKKLHEEEIPIKIPKKHNGRYNRLYAFLCNTRKIDSHIVNHLVKRKMLFEDSDYHNCVWLGYDYDETVQFGCKRITLDKDNTPKFILKDVPKKDVGSGVFLEKDKSKKLFIINSRLSINVFEGIMNKYPLETVVLGFDNKENSKNNKQASLKVLKATGFSGQILRVDTNAWKNQSNISDKYKFVAEPFIRGDLEGSKKHIGMFVDNKANSLFVTEAPIDAMSMMTMLKIHNLDFTKYNYLAQAGTIGISSLVYHMEHQPGIRTIYLCYDNDDAGEVARQNARIELNKIKFKGKVIDKIPTLNDWNDDLRALVEQRDKLLNPTLNKQNNTRQQKEKTQWEISY